MNNKFGCLLIHGFGGNVDEVSPLSDALSEHGYTVSCPSLKGHTGKRSDLYGCTYHHWIDSAEKAYLELRKNCNIIFLIGFSMGGLIAMQIASKYDVGAVITMNSPVFVWDLNNIVSNIIDDINNKKLDNIKGYVTSCTRFPIKSLINFRRLLKDTKGILSNITSPLLTSQALKDDTVKLKSAFYLYDHVSSKIKDIRFYQNAGHVILWSEDSFYVINDILDFLKMQQNYDILSHAQNDKFSLRD